MDEDVDSRGGSAVVLGAGLMGAALVRQLAASGVRVVVWNRTHSKASMLTGPGIVAVRQLAEALRAEGPVFICVGTYDDLRATLDPQDLSSLCIVNLTTGSRADAAEAASWAAARGALYLDGAILSYPDDVGSDRGSLVVSGPSGAWKAAAFAVTALGPNVRYLGDDIARANLVDEALVHLFHIPALVAFVEAAAVLSEGGVRPEVVKEHVGRMLVNFAHRTEMVVDDIASQDFRTDQAALATYARSTRMVGPALRADGIGAHMLDRARAVLDLADRAGHGAQSIAALSLLGRAEP